MKLRAVVVDERWWVAVHEGGLPRAEGEGPEEALLREFGVEVEVVAPLGEGTFVCRVVGEKGERLEWWAPSRAMKEMREPEEQRLVRKAMGPC